MSNRFFISQEVTHCSHFQNSPLVLLYLGFLEDLLDRVHPDNDKRKQWAKFLELSSKGTRKVTMVAILDWVHGHPSLA